MAKIKEVVPPAQPTYLVEMTQDEIDMLAGLAYDFVDKRTCYMVYPVDADNVRPTEHGMKVLKEFAASLISSEAPDYNYFTYWETVSDEEIKKIDDEDNPLRW